MVIQMGGIGSDDTVLDVACGPDLITCAVARVARHVTGIDLTPAMIEEARKRQQAMGLTNMEWRVGDVLPLPSLKCLSRPSSTAIRSTTSLNPKGCCPKW